MKKRVAFVFTSLVLFCAPVLGQTSGDLEKRFGPPVQAFEVARGVLMIPKFAEDGQLCEAVLESRHKVEKGFDLNDTLTDETVEQIVGILVPVSERGKKNNPYGFSMFMGQSYQTDYGYENVMVIGAGCRKCLEKNMAVFIKWKNRVCKGE